MTRGEHGPHVNSRVESHKAENEAARAAKATGDKIQPHPQRGGGLHLTGTLGAFARWQAAGNPTQKNKGKK